MLFLFESIRLPEQCYYSLRTSKLLKYIKSMSHILRNIKICWKLWNWFNAIKESLIKQPISQQIMEELIREVVALTNNNHSWLVTFMNSIKYKSIWRFRLFFVLQRSFRGTIRDVLPYLIIQNSNRSFWPIFFSVPFLLPDLRKGYS